MAKIEETLVVRTGIDAAFEYVAEFSNAASWDPGVRSSVKLTSGPLKVGDRYEVGATFGGMPVPMEYEIVELDAPHRAVLRGTSSRSVTIDDIRFEALSGGRTRITWGLEVQMKGLGAMTEPFMKPLLDHLGREAMRGLGEALGVEPEKEPGSVLWRGAAAALDALVAPAFARPGFEARARTWADPEIAVDLKGKTFVVTGANAGLGRATTEALVARGAHVVMACRSLERAERARDEIEARFSGASLFIEKVDMGDMDSVAALAERLASRDPVDGLIHNAGMLLDEPAQSPQGHELTFAVHVLGPFLLTSAMSDAGGLASGARVIFVSSGGMFTQRLRLETLATGPRNFDGTVAYAQAKRAQVMLAKRWAAVLGPRGVAVSAMHPGWADTDGVKTSLPRFYKITRSWLRTPEQGADTIVWLAASPEAAEAAGELYFDREPRSPHMPGARTRSSPEESDLLWALCERLSMAHTRQTVH